MRELEFSVMHFEPDVEQKLAPMLLAFEEQSGIHVRLRPLRWDKGWMEIAQFGLYGQGPDISEVGLSWIGSLAAMKCLRPFASHEIQSLGGSQRFFPSSWKAGFTPGSEQPWAIPWMGDPILTYYWAQDMEKAGVENPKTAFQDHNTLLTTLQKLRESGIRYPLSLTLYGSLRTLHEASAWIWAAGGELMSEDAHQVLFAEKQAIEGLKNYFSLLEFIHPDVINSPTPQPFFESHKVSVMPSGPWHAIYGRHIYMDWGPSIGISSLMKGAYVGGSSLVVWSHSKRKQECLEFVRFILAQPSGRTVSPHSIMLPVQQSNFETPEHSQDPFSQVCMQAMKQGRLFPTVKRWGSIEEKLNQELSNIWVDLFANPNQNINDCIHKRIDPLAKRLNLNLADA